MISDGKFRFTLQFPAETREQIRAGYLLERLGRKKSAVVVEALNEYVIRHFGANAEKEKTPPAAKKSVPSEPVETAPSEPIEESIPDSPPATSVEDPPAPAVQQVIVSPMVQDTESASAPEVGDDAFQQAILAMVADLDVFS